MLNVSRVLVRDATSSMIGEGGVSTCDAALTTNPSMQPSALGRGDEATCCHGCCQMTAGQQGIECDKWP